MCMFSRRVEKVANTSIFARASKEERQFLVYSMMLSAKDEVAMILPLPTPKNTDEDGVKFISLKEYPEFFKDMVKGFPVKASLGGRGKGAPKGRPEEPKLKVVEVGSFEASFVPTIRDFARLDERFRLPAGTWDELPKYKEYGFAVFKLKSGEKQIHPMALEFPRRNKRELFFPTVHVHDGKVHQTALFDHALYFQRSGGESTLRWTESDRPAGNFLKIEKCAGLVAKEMHVYRMLLVGRKTNQDTIVT